MRCLYVNQTVFPHFCFFPFRSKAMFQSSSLFPILLSGSPFSHHSGILVILQICKALPVSTSFPLFSLPRALFSGSLPLSASPHCFLYKWLFFIKVFAPPHIRSLHFSSPNSTSLTLAWPCHPSLVLPIFSITVWLNSCVYHHYSLDLGCLLKVHHQLMQC